MQARLFACAGGKLPAAKTAGRLAHAWRSAPMRRGQLSMITDQCAGVALQNNGAQRAEGFAAIAARTKVIVA